MTLWSTVSGSFLGIIQSKGGTFYDLGSGTGKPVIGAAVYHNFDVCYGKCWWAVNSSVIIFELSNISFTVHSNIVRNLLGFQKYWVYLLLNDTGIELLEGLYTVSLDALNAYNTRGKAKLNRGLREQIFTIYVLNECMYVCKYLCLYVCMYMLSRMYVSMYVYI